MSRDLNKEFQDIENKKYSYDFDATLRHYMLKAFAPFMNSNDKVLEMGCYKGEFTQMLSKYYKDITVIEGSQELSDIAGKNNPGVKIICSYFENWIPQEKYDAIFLIHTLEHLDDPVGVLQIAKNALSEKGKLFVVVPNANAASRQIAVNMGLISHNSAVTEGERVHGHRITYSMDTLQRNIIAAKLNITYKTGIFFKPLANFQLDSALKQGVIDEKYLDGCFNLGFQYPELAASVFCLCS